MLSFDDRVQRVARTLEDAGIPHAFGGAIALAYAAQPRATTDIDINIFVPESDSEAVLRVLVSMGVAVDIARDSARARRDGQLRIPWDQTLVDLFFSTTAFHDSARDRIQRVPYGDSEIRVLSAEDLAVCKILFNREKDWVDLRELVRLQGGELDVPYIRGWLADFLGIDDTRIAHFDALLADTPPSRS